MITGNNYTLLVVCSASAFLQACGSSSDTSTEVLSGDSLLGMLNSPPTNDIPPSTQAPTVNPNFTPRYEATAQTMSQLLAELRVGAAINLPAKQYLLSETDQNDFGAYYYWQKNAKSPSQLVLRDLDSLVIKAANENVTPILSNQTEGGSVLILENCKKVSLDNLILQNISGGDNQAGGTLILRNCEDIYINNCQFKGFTALGLEISNSKNIYLDNLDAQGCTQKMVHLDSCQKVQLTNSRLHSSKIASGALIEMHNSNEIHLDNVELDNNVVEEPLDTFNTLFFTSNCTGVTVLNSKIARNTLGTLTTFVGDKLQLKNTQLEENYFGIAEELARTGN